MWLTLGFISIVALVLGSITWIQTRGTKLANGVIVETKDNLKDFLFAILQDNDAQQRTNGLPESNLIELYQQSMEAAELLSKLPPQIQYADLY